MLSQAAPQLEPLAPHNVLAKLQQVLMVKPASTPPPAETPPPTPIPTRQNTNIGLYKQRQTVGKRARVGELNDTGYVTGLGDVAHWWNEPPPSETLSVEAPRVPTAVGLAGIAATNERGYKAEEQSPVTEDKNKYTLYAPKKVKTSVF
jgi:hypothetical protein